MAGAPRPGAQFVKVSMTDSTPRPAIVGAMAGEPRPRAQFVKVSTTDSAGAMAGGPRPRAQFVKVSVARALTRTADFAAVLPLYFIFYLYEFPFFALISSLYFR